MKRFYAVIAFCFLAGLLIALLILLGGCVGLKKAPPTQTEQQLFRITTNYVPRVEYVTNTGVVTVTNYVPVYDYRPGPGAREVRDVGTEIGNFFGVGGLVGTALGAVFSIWASIRSNRQRAVSANLAQAVEMMREFIRQLPQGADYDAAITRWLTSNQAEAGVIDQVLEILAKDVSNPEAQVAAANLHRAFHAVTGPRKVT